MVAHETERGSALLVCLVAVVFLTGLSTSVLTVNLSHNDEVSFYSNRILARSTWLKPGSITASRL